MDSEGREQEQAKKSWGGLTDPNNHNPYNFRYLVHTINPLAKSSIGLLALTDPRFKDYQPGGQEDPSVDLLEHPEMIAHRVGLSASLIDQYHSKTWGSVGLIIEANVGNVVETISEDAGTPTWDRETLLNKKQKEKILLPEELLALTDPNKYNEVALLVVNGADDVKLKGFVVKTYDDGSPIDPRLALIIKDHSERLGLPLVYIKDPNPYKEDKVLRVENGYIVHKNSKRYILLDTGIYAFRLLDQAGKSLVISPEDLETAFSYLRENNISEDTIKTIKENYLVYDRKRREPKIEYTSEDEVKFVLRRSGYGIDEIEMYILSNGESGIRHILEFEQALLSQISNQKVVSLEKILLSPDQADQMIEDAINELSEDKKTAIVEWYDIVRERIVREWGSRQKIKIPQLMDLKFFLKPKN